MSKTIWALVTGASSGIGLEFAKILGSHGVNLVLSARSKEELVTLAHHLTTTYHTENLVFAGDLSQQSVAEELVKYLEKQKMSLAYLVNNAGFGDFGYFTETKWEKEEKMLDLNIKTLTYLTKIYATQMKKLGHGRIVNVASGAAFQPGPLMAVYFATKAYVLHFSEAVAEELAGTGVTITALCPGPTESNFWEAANKPSMIHFLPGGMPSAAKVAQYGYEAMMRGDRVAIYGLVNRLAAFAVRFAPRQFVTKVIMSGQK